MAFNWNAAKIVNEKGLVLKSFESTGSITMVKFEDGSNGTYWTDTGDVWKEGHPNIGKDYYLTVVDPKSDEELVKAYREADALAGELGAELLERGFTIIDEDGDEVPYFIGVQRIYKLEERDF